MLLLLAQILLLLLHLLIYLVVLIIYFYAHYLLPPLNSILIIICCSLPHWQNCFLFFLYLVSVSCRGWENVNASYSYRDWKGAFIGTSIDIFSPSENYSFKLTFSNPPSPIIGSLHPQPSSAPTSDLPITLQKEKCSTTVHYISKFVFYNKITSLFHLISFSLSFVSIPRSF